MLKFALGLLIGATVVAFGQHRKPDAENFSIAMTTPLAHLMAGQAEQSRKATVIQTDEFGYVICARW